MYLQEVTLGNYCRALLDNPSAPALLSALKGSSGGGGSGGRDESSGGTHSALDVVGACGAHVSFFNGVVVPWCSVAEVCFVLGGGAG